MNDEGRVRGHGAEADAVADSVADGGRAIGVRLADREESALEEAYAAYAPVLLRYLSRYD